MSSHEPGASHLIYLEHNSRARSSNEWLIVLEENAIIITGLALVIVVGTIASFALAQQT